MSGADEDFAESLEDGCFVVCNDNVTGTPESDVIRLKFLTNPYAWWIQPIARHFEASKGGGVAIEFVEVPRNQLDADIINEATSQIGLYDGFVAGPGVSGSIVEYNGWADLTSFIQETAERTADWSDILLGYRQYIAQYQERIIMYPLDGDLFHMFYRTDILEHFDLQVPRTWDEYSAVASQIHGKVYENQTLVGSCVGRALNCAGSYYANLLLAQITQTQGSWSGHSFDSSTMKPLTGAAMEQVLKWMETQVKHGPDEEFDQCIALNFELMHQGRCALTYNWGNSFKRYLEEGSKLRGRYGVAPTPGSTRVLDRETMELVDCDKDRCKYGNYYEDIGWANHAPYLAFGGYACSANNYTSPVTKRLAMEFCAFAASKKESVKAIIPNATDASATRNGQDPFRLSHLDLDLYVKNGYDRDTAKQYIDAILTGLDSDNAVIDNRFATATKLENLCEREFFDYLNATKHGLIPEPELPERRKELVQRLTNQWNEIIANYDAQGTTRDSVLEGYQKLRGVYSFEQDYNHLGNIRGYGLALMGLTMIWSAVFAIWTLKYRRTPVIRASQPFFLVMICVGTIVLSSTIIPLGIDDGVASEAGCSAACMAIPWLLALGWTIVFSAIFAKLKRINIVTKSARHFQRIQVSERDVLLPFFVLLSTNLILLITWTIVDPLHWERVIKTKTDSYGACSVHSESTTWKVIVALIATANGLTLILANVEAYRARQIATEFSESKYIALAMASILQVVMVGVPLLFLVDDDPIANYFIRSSMVFIVSMAIILWMSVPKVLVWWKRKDESEPSRKSTNVSGLSFRVGGESSNITETERKLDAYRAKAALLEDVVRKQGFDPDTLFQEAGLDHSEISDIPSKQTSFFAPSSSLKSSINTISDALEQAKATEPLPNIPSSQELGKEDAPESEVQ